jgi:hypothetical protein
MTVLEMEARPRCRDPVALSTPVEN